MVLHFRRAGSAASIGGRVGIGDEAAGVAHSESKLINSTNELMRLSIVLCNDSKSTLNMAIKNNCIMQ